MTLSTPDLKTLRLALETRALAKACSAGLASAAGSYTRRSWRMVGAGDSVRDPGRGERLRLGGFAGGSPNWILLDRDVLLQGDRERVFAGRMCGGGIEDELGVYRVGSFWK